MTEQEEDNKVVEKHVRNWNCNCDSLCKNDKKKTTIFRFWIVYLTLTRNECRHENKQNRKQQTEMGSTFSFKGLRCDEWVDGNNFNSILFFHMRCAMVCACVWVHAWLPPTTNDKLYTRDLSFWMNIRTVINAREATWRVPIIISRAMEMSRLIIASQYKNSHDLFIIMFVIFLHHNFEQYISIWRCKFLLILLVCQSSLNISRQIWWTDPKTSLVCSFIANLCTTEKPHWLSNPFYRMHTDEREKPIFAHPTDLLLNYVFMFLQNKFVRPLYSHSLLYK